MNPAESAEYQSIRLRIAEMVRELETIRRTEEGDVLLLSFDHMRLEVEELAHHVPARVYRLINDGSIGPATGTSLINDYGYACDILRNLLQAAGTLFPDTRQALHSAQRAVVLDATELRNLMLEQDPTPPPHSPEE